jgi:hypothetical protein
MFPQVAETFICVNLCKSADKSGLPFTLSSGKSENNIPTVQLVDVDYPVNPVKSKGGNAYGKNKD